MIAFPIPVEQTLDIKCPAQECKTMSSERSVKDLSGLYTKEGGAPKGTTFELFSESLCQVRQRLKFSFDPDLVFVGHFVAALPQIEFSLGGGN